MGERQDVHDEVVASIRRSLPEFAKRNGIEMTDKQMNNLANWTAATVLPNAYRRGCPVDGACACMGICKSWYLLGDQ